MCISLVHEALLLVDEILLELLLPDLLELHLALDLPLDSLLLSLFTLRSSLLLVIVSFQQCLIFLLLPINALNGLLVLSLLLRSLFIW